MPILRDELPLAAIGEGLTGILPHLNGKDNGGAKLLELIERIKAGYRVGFEIAGYLMIIAFRNRWPRWAIRVLVCELPPCWNSEIEDVMKQAEGAPQPEAWAAHVAEMVERCFYQQDDPRAAASFSRIKRLELARFNLGVQELEYA